VDFPERNDRIAFGLSFLISSSMNDIGADSMSDNPEETTGFSGTNNDFENALRYQEITFATLLHMKDRYSDRFDGIMLDSFREITQALAEFKQGIEQISLAVGEISRATESISSSAREQRDLAAQITGTIQSSGAASAESHVQLGNLDQRIVELKQHSADIGSLVKNVDDIAEVLNILSINGAIQAARSGDRGKGFAIVTGEMRKLAMNVKQSASRQMGAIDTVIRLIGEAAGMSESVKLRAESTKDSMRIAGEKIADLQGHLDRVASNCQELAASVHEFSATIEQISRSIANIEEMMKRISGAFGSNTRFNQVVTEVCGECAGIADGSSSLEEAAGKQMRHLVEKIESMDGVGKKAVLAQLYLSLPYASLPDSAKMHFKSAGRSPLPEDRYFCLMGSAGPQPRQADLNYIRLPEKETDLQDPPIFSKIFSEFGIPYQSIIRPRKGEIQKMGGFFLIEDAGASPYLADKRFLLENGIASQISIGGFTLSGAVFAILLWFRDKLTAEMAESMSIMGPSFQLNMRSLCDSGRYWQ
jgi:methyl-accepting chemotaxis protein